MISLAFMLLMFLIYFSIISMLDVEATLLVVTMTFLPADWMKSASMLDLYYHKWSLTICDGCFDTLKSSKMRS